MSSDALGSALRAALGEAAVRGEHDAIRVRAASVDDVRTVLRLAASLDARVAVPGGDLAPGPGVISLDLDGLARVSSLDVESRTIHVEGGASLGMTEAYLRARGLTLGTVEGAASERSTISAWLAQGAWGARAHADDPVDQLVCGLEVVLADGQLLTIRPAPRRAVGPDLVPSFVGGRACLGVIVGAHLVARGVVPHTDVTYRFATRAAGESARAWVRGRGVRPASTALLYDGPAVTYLLVRVEGRHAMREASLSVVDDIARARGGERCEMPDSLRAPTPPQPAPPSDTVRALARVLDPAGVLRAQ